MTKWKYWFPFDSYRTHQEETLVKIADAFSKHRFVFFQGPCGCHAKGTKILMYDGSLRNVEDIVVGDVLVGPDSSPRKVVQLHRGRDKMAEIKPQKGDPFVVNLGHILSLRSTIINHNPIINISVKEYFTKSDTFKCAYKLYRAPVTHWSKKDLSIPPYIFGTNPTVGANEPIPNAYLTSSYEQRLELLAGLLDGSSTPRGFDFINANESLADGVVFLARSLGLAANKKQNKVSISGDTSIIPCRVPRKTEPKQLKNVLNTAFTVKELPEDDYFGFEVSADHLYLMGDFTVTHNSGKSATGVSIGNHFKPAYIATVQKHLQDQYQDDFHLPVLKGKSNYQCSYDWTDDAGRKLLNTCDSAPCGLNVTTKAGKAVSESCKQLQACPYINARDIAFSSDVALLNFSNLLAFSAIPNALPRKQTLILDECHNLQSELYKFAEVTFTPRIYRDIILDPQDNKLLERGFASIEDAVEFCERTNPLLIAHHAFVSNNSKATHKEVRRAEDLLKQAQKKERFVTTVKEGREFVLKPTEEGPGCKLAPLRVDHMGSLAFSCADKILLMSATILNAEIMAKSLGIQDYEYIEVPSTFPAKNRTTISIPVGSMSYKNIQDTFPDMAMMVKKITTKHKHEKGLIQTFNYKIVTMLKEALGDFGNERFLFHTKEMSKDQLIQEHFESPEPTILVGPGFKEGLDLKDDLCYDSETEILTEIGWVLFPDLIEGIKVAAFNPENEELKFEIPSQIIQTTGKEWVEFDTGTNNLMVTKNHRMLWRTAEHGKFKETKAGDFDRSYRHYQFINAGHLQSEGLDFTDLELRLAAAYQADGCWIDDEQLYARIVFVKDRKAERLLEILTELKADFKITTNKRKHKIFLLNKKHLVKVRALFDVVHKHWDVIALLKLSHNQRLLLLDELTYWGTRNGNRVCYSSSKPENINAIQAVCASVGLRSYYNTHSLLWSVDTAYSYFVPTEHNYILKDYPIEMPAYCVTVSTGWVLVRRRGKITVSGNCRFQILMKVPCADLKDPVIARRSQIEPEWYALMTAMDITQMLGRDVRSDTDFSIHYILDSYFQNFYGRYKKFFPQDVRETIFMADYAP